MWSSKRLFHCTTEEQLIKEFTLAKKAYKGCTVSDEERERLTEDLQSLRKYYGSLWTDAAVESMKTCLSPVLSGDTLKSLSPVDLVTVAEDMEGAGLTPEQEAYLKKMVNVNELFEGNDVRNIKIEYWTSTDIVKIYEGDHTEEIKSYLGHSSIVLEASNVERLTEIDWDMVYLSRANEASNGRISWGFNIKDISLDEVHITAPVTLFRDGAVKWKVTTGEFPSEDEESKGSSGFITKEKEVLFQDDKLQLKEWKDLDRPAFFILEAELSGTEEPAHQNSQLFRQSTTDPRSLFRIEFIASVPAEVSGKSSPMKSKWNLFRGRKRLRGKGGKKPAATAAFRFEPPPSEGPVFSSVTSSTRPSVSPSPPSFSFGAPAPPTIPSGFSSSGAFTTPATFIPPFPSVGAPLSTSTSVNSAGGSSTYVTPTFSFGSSSSPFSFGQPSSSTIGGIFGTPGGGGFATSFSTGGGFSFGSSTGSSGFGSTSGGFSFGPPSNTPGFWEMPRRNQ